MPEKPSAIIRPGQFKPYSKGTMSQIDERRGFVARMLFAGATKAQIHRAVRARFNVEWRQCDRYISWLAHPRAQRHHQKYRSNVIAQLRILYKDKGQQRLPKWDFTATHFPR
jgi:ribosomal protein L23